MKIADGTPEDHPTPLGLDASATPGVAPPPVTSGSGTEQGGVRDCTGERLSQLAAAEAEISGAQHSGMSADGGRRRKYELDMAPLAASYGDEMTLPQVTSDMSKHTGSPGSPGAGPAG